MACPRRDAVESEQRTETPLKVLIADDHPLVLMGIRRTLEASEDIEVVGEAHSGPEVLALVERRGPNVVLLDLRMPGVEGVACISQITESWPDVKVVVLSACDDGPSVQSALAAGASAYVVKSVKPIDIASVLRQAGGAGAVFHAPVGPAGGGRTDHAMVPAGPALTERETAILGAVAGGLTTKSIGGELWISEHTVKFHLTNIYRKLGVSNRSSAVRYAIENGLATSTRARCGRAGEAIGR
jgi:DNA-binding NarL/FixJ family response regulator